MTTAHVELMAPSSASSSATSPTKSTTTRTNRNARTKPTSTTTSTKPKPKAKPKKRAPQVQSRKRKINKTLEQLFIEDELQMIRCEHCEKPYTQLSLLEDHKNNCINNPKRNTAKHQKQKQMEKANFFSFLGLGLTNAANVLNKVKEPESEIKPPHPLSTTSEKYRKSQINSYFKPNTMPINNPYSAKLIRRGIGSCLEPERCIEKYEDFCTAKKPKISVKNETRAKSSRINSKEQEKEEEPVEMEYEVTHSKKYLSKIKEGDYVHEYCFNRYQRIKRDNELTIGINMKCFKLLNKCKPLKVKVTPMQDSEIAEYLNRLVGLPKRFRITLPIPKDQTCVVELDDIKYKQEYSYLFNNKTEEIKKNDV